MIVQIKIQDATGLKTGLTPSLTAYDLSDDSKALDGVTMTEVENGIYKYDFTAYDSSVDYAYHVDCGESLAGKGRYGGGGSEMSGEITLIKAQTDDQPAGIKKGVALSNFPFKMIDSGDHESPLASKTVTGVIKKDGGAWASLANSVTYDDNYIYLYSFTANEMAADIVTAVMSAAGCDDTTIILKTSA